MRPRTVSLFPLLAVGICLVGASFVARRVQAYELPVPQVAPAAPASAAPSAAHALPELLQGTMTITRTDSNGGQLTLTWSGVLESGKQYTDVTGTFIGGYGLGSGSIHLTGSETYTIKNTLGQDIAQHNFTYYGHVPSPREHLSIYLEGTPSRLQARVGTYSTCRYTHTTRTLLDSPPHTYTDSGQAQFEMKGLPGTAATRVSLTKAGVLSVAWSGTTYQSGGYSYSISGTLQGKGAWAVLADHNPVPFHDGSPSSVTVRALGVPNGARVTWVGAPRGSTFADGQRTATMPFAAPGKYTIKTIYKGQTVSTDLYVVQVKFAGTLQRVDPTGERTLPKSVPFNNTGDEQVQITPDLSQSPYAVDLDVDDGGDSHAGAASVQPSRLTGSGPIKVLGLLQTEPGFAAQLHLRAQVSGVLAAMGAPQDGFSVCAHPSSIAYVYDRPLAGENTPRNGPVWGQAYALNVPQITIMSDSGNAQDLDHAKLAEAVEIGPATGIFTLTPGSDTSTEFGPCLGGYIDYHGLPGTAQDIQDLFDRAHPQATGDAGQETAYQLIRYACDRCGIPATKDGAAAIPRSGFEIDYHAYKTAGRYFLEIRKQGTRYRGTQPGLVDNTDAHILEVK